MKVSQIISDEVARGATGTIDDLESPLVPVGHYMEVTHVAVENRTTAYTRLTIGIAGGLDFYEKEEEDFPPANDIFWTRSKFLIPAGKKLRARLTGCTALDDLHMAYQGYLYALTGK